MEEGLFFFPPFEPLPSLSSWDLHALTRKHAFHYKTYSDFVAEFDVLCHIQGVMYYRMRPGKRLKGAYADKEFISRDASDFVHVVVTHARNDDNDKPQEVMAHRYLLPLEAFYDIVMIYVKKGDLAEVKTKWKRISFSFVVGVLGLLCP